MTQTRSNEGSAPALTPCPHNVAPGAPCFTCYPACIDCGDEPASGGGERCEACYGAHVRRAEAEGIAKLGAALNPELNAKGYPVALPEGAPHYDYANQCWIDADGRVSACGHQGADPVCYACTAAGKVHTCQGECA